VTLLRDHVLQLEGVLGSSELRLEVNEARVEEGKIQWNTVLQEEESVDMAEMITQYVASETAYKAMLDSVARIMSLPNMFDLMR